MKSFIDWAEKEKKELPLFEPMGENTKRGGIATWAYANYPRDAYPNAYFLPSAADAIQKLQISKKNKDKK